VCAVKRVQEGVGLFRVGSRELASTGGRDVDAGGRGADRGGGQGWTLCSGGTGRCGRPRSAGPRQLCPYRLPVVVVQYARGSAVPGQGSAVHAWARCSRPAFRVADPEPTRGARCGRGPGAVAGVGDGVGDEFGGHRGGVRPLTETPLVARVAHEVCGARNGVGLRGQVASHPAGFRVTEGAALIRSMMPPADRPSTVSSRCQALEVGSRSKG